MKHTTFARAGVTYYRISKTDAWRRHKDEPVYAMGDREREFDSDGEPIYTTMACLKPEQDFEQFEDEFMYYLPREMGRRVKWYAVLWDRRWATK